MSNKSYMVSKCRNCFVRTLLFHLEDHEDRLQFFKMELYIFYYPLISTHNSTFVHTTLIKKY